MAFLRFTRDKRGYEHFSLVEPITNRRGKTRTRVLYWYRTPPNVRVGREPFAESVRRELESQNPDVQFDWRKIVDTPVPSAETDRWRERRRAEKAEKAARRARAADVEPEAIDSRANGEDDIDVETAAAVDAAPADTVAAVATSAVDVERARQRRRRRRRGRRGAAVPQPVEGDQPVEPAFESAPASSDPHEE